MFLEIVIENYTTISMFKFMKKQKNDVRQNANYTFSVSNNDDMIFWSKGSTQQYLSTPTKLIESLGITKSDKSGIITKPNSVINNILGRYGITAMAHTQRMANFYHFVNMTTFTNLEFVLSGSLSFRINDQKFKVGAGETLILPKGTSGQLRILSDNTKIFWINVNTKCEIFKHAGKNVAVKSFASFSEITTILKLYQSEIYNRNDPQILENYATTFYGLLMRELTETHTQQPKLERLKRLVSNININPETEVTTTSAAKKTRMTIYELDKLSLEIYGEKFSKVVLAIRMKEAMRLLKTNQLSCSEVAQKTGYKSPFSFSRAFKDYYGKPPSQIDK